MCMKRIFIIHGAFGHPEENWFPWLKSQSERLGHEVFVPAFPTPKGQTLEDWNSIFSEYETKVDENTILVGHSLGPAFLLHVLGRINTTIKASFFVSGFISPLGNETFDPLNKTFLEKPFDWQKIHQNCNQFFLYHSDDDPYVSMAHANELAKKLGVKTRIIQDAGHFNEDAGYDRFVALFHDMQPLL